MLAYALAGTVNIDFETQPLGIDSNGKEVFLREIWPMKDEINETISKFLTPKMFVDNYKAIAKGTDRWNKLQVTESKLYQWKPESTYIHNPPFFSSMEKTLPKIVDIQNAYCLGNFGDSITTDHISPAANINKNSPAGRFLLEKGVAQNDFNTYGARRGNFK